MVRKNKQAAIPHIELLLLWIKDWVDQFGLWYLYPHSIPVTSYLPTFSYLLFLFLSFEHQYLLGDIPLVLHCNDLEQFWSLPFKLSVKFQAWVDHSNGCLQEVFSLSYRWGQKTGFRSCTNRIWKKKVAVVKGKFKRVGVENKIGSRNAQQIKKWAHQRRRGKCRYVSPCEPRHTQRICAVSLLLPSATYIYQLHRMPSGSNNVIEFLVQHSNITFFLNYSTFQK